MKNLIIFFGFLFLSGCASMMADWQAANCNEEAAYAQGMNDGREGKTMSSAYASQCPSQTQERVRGSYRIGYTDGLASKKQDSPLINVQIGNQDKHKWLCEIETFGQTFSAWGTTQLAAEQNTIAKCTSQYHKMHCDEVRCRQ